MSGILITKAKRSEDEMRRRGGKERGRGREREHHR
jgi:hypothetical protein